MNTSHVQVVFRDGRGVVLVNGIEVDVLAEGFEVDFAATPPVVSMRLLADVLDVDLEGARVVEPVRRPCEFDAASPGCPACAAEEVRQ